MSNHYRRSDYVASLLVSGLLCFIAAIANLIVASGDIEILKTIVLIVYFTMSAVFIFLSVVYNSTGHSITISDKIMAIKCHKEFIFISGELASSKKTVFGYRKFTVNLAEIESFGAFDGQEIYKYSFDKHFPMHIKMRPVITDSFVGEMLISFVKCVPGHLNALYDRETEDDSAILMDEATKKILSECRFLIFNLKDKRQVILYLKGYNMFDGLRIISHITNVSHLQPLFQSNHPEYHFQEHRFSQSRATFFLIVAAIVPTIILLTIFININPVPNDIFFYPLKALLIFLTMLFGHRLYYVVMRVFYQSKRKQLRAFLTRSYILLHVLEFSFLIFLMVFVEYLLFIINA